MPRPFREALASTPVVLEIVPPGRRVSEKAVNTFVERVRDSVRSLENLDAVNIPEVLEENHAGQPFYRDLDPRDFAALLGDLGVDPIVNKVVAHVPSESLLRRWIHESLEQHALRNFVLVGGNSSRVRYPGPSVVEANRLLGPQRRDVPTSPSGTSRSRNAITRSIDSSRRRGRAAISSRRKCCSKRSRWRRSSGHTAGGAPRRT